MNQPDVHTPEVFKVCVQDSEKPVPAGWVRCVIGRSRDIEFSGEALRSYCFAPWDVIIYDLLLVAAAVNFCDWSKKRSAACWSRSFELHVPVHDPARWNAPPVRDALHDVLRFLTGDAWRIEFVGRQAPVEAPMQQTLPIPANARAVIAFSNGLDSCSVAGWHEAEQGEGSLIRVRVGRGETRLRKTRFTRIPFKVRPHGHSHETSGRSRGFKFAAASGLAAHLSGVSEIIVPESGQGALGPVLVRFAGMYSDYRNHPRFFRLMEAFLEALLGQRLHFRLPRLASTKGESLQAFLTHPRVSRDAAGAELLDTRSCWQDRHYVAVGDGRKRQCGVCAACMLRRLSVHVAGLKEPETTYSWSDLNASDLHAAAPDKYKNKIGPKLRQYALAGTLHLSQLSRLRRHYDYADVISRHAVDLAEATGSNHLDVERWLGELLERHDAQWRSFLDTLSANSFVKQWAGLS